MFHALLQIITVWLAVIFCLVFIFNAQKKLSIFTISLILFILCLSLYTVSREKLVPYNADTERRSGLLTGDEPDYLLTAVSVARDGDIDVHNNILQHDYQLFQESLSGVGGWEYSYFNDLSSGRISSRKKQWGSSKYMQHRPGISFFLAPVFLFLKSNYRWWSYFLISLALAIFTVSSYLAARKLGIRSKDALIACFIFTASPPVFFYANQIYPEVMAGILLASSAWLLQIQGRRLLLSFILLALVIWFTDRALPAFAILALSSFLCLNKVRHRIFAIISLGISLGFFAYYCWYRFGVPFPISHNPWAGFSLNRLPLRIFQILFDGMQGWFWLFPPLLLLPAVFFDLFSENKNSANTIALTAALSASLLLIASFDDWRGGWNPRGRYYVIPQLIFLVLFLKWLSRNNNIRQIGIFWLIILGAIPLTTLPWLIDNPHWWFRLYHPFFGWEAIQPLYRFIPNLSDDCGFREWLKLLIWLPVLSIPSLSCILAGYRKKETSVK